MNGQSAFLLDPTSHFAASKKFSQFMTGGQATMILFKCFYGGSTRCECMETYSVQVDEEVTEVIFFYMSIFLFFYKFYLGRAQR